MMQLTACEELDNYLPFNDDYAEEEMHNGYEVIKIQNLHMKLMLEEDIEWMLDNADYLFSDDSRTFTNSCIECNSKPYVWEANKHLMILYK